MRPAITEMEQKPNGVGGNGSGGTSGNIRKWLTNMTPQQQLKLFCSYLQTDTSTGVVRWMRRGNCDKCKRILVFGLSGLLTFAMRA